MAFDGIVTKAIASELQNLSGARIDKILEPNKNTIVIGLYLNGHNYALTLCIEAQNYRLNLTTHPKENPQVAPSFCMLLRKHLLGLRLKNVITFDLERLVIFEFEGFDDIDDLVSKKLVVELMGKHSNIILLQEGNIILDSMRHAKNVDGNYRDILPHSHYVFPTCDKKSFIDLNSFDEFYNSIDCSKISDLPFYISNLYNGISKSFIQFSLKNLHISEVTKTNLEILYNYIKDIINRIETDELYFSTILDDSGIAKDYSLIPDDFHSDFALNFFIDEYYYKKESTSDFKNNRNAVLKLILDVLKKYNKRLENINEKLKECENMDTYKLYGELITANLYKFADYNLDKIEVENYYDNNKIITIPLDKRYSLGNNAKRYFKKYHKLKNTLEIVSVQKKETLQELDYIESIVYELENCSTIQEVSSIFEEISENVIFKERSNSFIKSKSNKKIKKSKLTKNKEVSFNPIKYQFDGYTIFVGRNNKENDYLTLKFAGKTDIWFHTKDIHGSHVILKIPTNSTTPTMPSNEILIKCAQIAAFHSKASNSSNVPVDYCYVKYVKKPSGSKPGMVIYTNYQTLNVQPKIGDRSH